MKEWTTMQLLLAYFEVFNSLIYQGGCAGLSSAIRLKREASKRNQELSICVLEKGESIGSHVLSGCLMETDALSILIPDWKERVSYFYLR